MRVGVFVGSFNPVHVGHIKIANYVLEQYLDKVIFVPTGNYWDKQNLISIQDRVNMLKYYENDSIIIDEENNECPYTYQILENIQKKYEKDDLYLIIGADNIVHFEKWKNYQELLKYHFIIINRDAIDVSFYLNKLNKKDRYYITETLPNIFISSTFIRDNIRDCHYENIEDKVSKKVLNYIINHHLYK